MKSGTRLDSAFFQLTPTRTRYDLVITSNKKIEKIASGLIDPFLTHLKVARDQIDEGGYSVVLEPKFGTDAPWFTKGTVERFVGFVSNPEVLERAYAIESEIIQIDEAIANQKNNYPGLNTLEAKKEKLSYSTGVDLSTKSISTANEEMAIVVYKPGMQSPPEKSKSQDGNPKVQLLNVLETRKLGLQNEQGMAFARAVAAGFDLNHIPLLISFAECFGALRFMNGCYRFIDMWNKKHETGQWLDIEEDETTSCTSGIVKGPPESYAINNSENLENKAAPVGQETPVWNQGYMQHSQFPHPVFTSWPVRPPSDAMPYFHPYPMPPIPYYHHERVIPHKSIGRRRHSMDSVGGNIETEDCEERDYEMSPDDQELDRHESQGHMNCKRFSSSSKKNICSHSIPNVNYSTSRDLTSTGSDSQSESDNIKEIRVRVSEARNESRSAPLRKQVVEHSFDTTDLQASKQDTGGSLWQEFQNCLSIDCDEHRSDQSPIHNDEFHNGRLKGKGNSDYQSSVFTSDDVNRFDCDQKMFPLEVMGERGRGFQHNVEQDPFISAQHDSDGLIPLNLPPMEIVSERKLVPEISDESFMVQMRSDMVRMGDNYDRGRVITFLEEKEEMSLNLESENLDFMMLNRGEEMRSGCYDPVLDYELPLHYSNEKSDSPCTVNRKTGELTVSSGSEKKITRITTKGKPSKLNPQDEARVRAEKMRSYKVGLQKIKREKEEEEVRRLAALKAERQKRIAARNSPIPALATHTTTTRQLPVRLAPASRFRDTEPRHTSTPLRQKFQKPAPAPRLSRSASPVPKPKVSATGLRRLSECKTANIVSEPKTANSVSEPKTANSVYESKTVHSGRISEPKTANSRRVSEPKTTVKSCRVSEPKTANIRRVSEPKTTVNSRVSEPKTTVNSLVSEPKTTVNTCASEPKRAASTNSISKMQAPPSRQGVKKTHLAVENTTVPVKKEASSTISEIIKQNIPESGEKNEESQVVVAEKTIMMLDLEKPKRLSEVEDNSPQCEIAKRWDDGGHISGEAYHARAASLLEDAGSNYRVAEMSGGERCGDAKEEERRNRVRGDERGPRGFKRLLVFGKKKRSCSSGDQFEEFGDQQDDTGPEDGYKVRSMICEERAVAVSTTTTSSSSNSKKSSRSPFSLLSPFKTKSSEKRAPLSAALAT